MGLSWQQGPLGRNPNGQFLVPAMPERVLYAEPLRRRLRAELGGRTIVESDDAVLLFEPGRYPVAYFPRADFAEGALKPIEHRSRHRDLGETAWFEVVRRHAPGDPRRLAARRAPARTRRCSTSTSRWRGGRWTASTRRTSASSATPSDPYHRIDIRRSSRHLVVRAGDRVIADTTAPLVLTSRASRRAGTCRAPTSSPTR